MSLNRKRLHTSQEDHFSKRQVQRYENIAKLYNTQPGRPHIVIPRKPNGVIIGRSSSCDVKITGADVSSRHCQLTLTIKNNEEYLYISDLSSNGVFVNDEILGKGTNAILKSGDKIAFAKKGGTYIFRYSFEDERVQDEQSKKTHRRTFFDDFILGNQLGSGHYAVVKEARDRSTGDIVAVKIFHPNRSTASIDERTAQNNDSKLQQEMNLLLSINHPNIVKFISHYVEPVNKNSVTTYLVLEKMNSGELFQRVINKSKLRQDETKAIFKQLLSGVEYLHKNNIIHRDIKPENILLDIIPRASPSQKQTGPWDDDEYHVTVKIADFGLAKFIGELKFTNTLCGTPAYVAPEILKNDRNYSTKVDLWSAGVLLYVCLCGFPPFSEELAPPNMKDQILEGKYAFYSPYWDDIADSALDLISNLLVVDARERFDINQTCSHYWFSETDNAPTAMDITSDTEEQDMEEDSVGPLRSSGSIKRTVLRSDTQPMTLKERFTSELNFGSSIV